MASSAWYVRQTKRILYICLLSALFYLLIMDPPWNWGHGLGVGIRAYHRANTKALVRKKGAVADPSTKSPWNMFAFTSTLAHLRNPTVNKKDEEHDITLTEGKKKYIKAATSEKDKKAPSKNHVETESVTLNMAKTVEKTVPELEGALVEDAAAAHFEIPIEAAVVNRPATVKKPAVLTKPIDAHTAGIVPTAGAYIPRTNMGINEQSMVEIDSFPKAMSGAVPGAIPATQPGKLPVTLPKVVAAFNHAIMPAAVPRFPHTTMPPRNYPVNVRSNPPNTAVAGIQQTGQVGLTSQSFGTFTKAADVQEADVSRVAKGGILVIRAIPTEDFAAVKGYRGVVVNNRVPRCYGLITSYLFHDLAEQNQFQIYTDPQNRNYGLLPDEQNAVIHHIFTYPRPVLYEKYMYLVNFTTFNRPWPIHINVIRDPVQRYVSRYYDQVEQCRRKESPICKRMPLARKYNINQCVQRRYPYCTCEEAGDGCKGMLQFFCGNDPSCRKASLAALQRAMTNVQKYYAVVGMTDQIYRYFRVLQRLLPRYFNTLPGHYLKRRGEGKLNPFMDVVTPAPSNQTTAFLRDKFKYDYYFYQFVKQRFYAQYIKLFGSL